MSRTDGSAWNARTRWPTPSSAPANGPSRRGTGSARRTACGGPPRRPGGLAPSRCWRRSGSWPATPVSRSTRTPPPRATRWSGSGCPSGRRRCFCSSPPEAPTVRSANGPSSAPRSSSFRCAARWPSWASAAAARRRPPPIASACSTTPEPAGGGRRRGLPDDPLGHAAGGRIEAPAEDRAGVDADDVVAALRRLQDGGLGAPADLDAADTPRPDRDEVVHDERDLVVAADVAVLARLGEVVAADVDGAGLGVVDE